MQKGTSKAFNRFTRKQEQITENLVDILPERTKISFEFEDESISSNICLEVFELAKSFEEKLLFRHLSFTSVNGDRLVMRRCSILLLDEPTNHIDFPSLEVIEEALLNFPGIIIAATHDRYFTEKIATEILNLSEFNDSSHSEKVLQSSEERLK